MESDVRWRAREGNETNKSSRKRKRQELGSASPSRFYRGKVPQADVHWRRFLERTAEQRAEERESLKRLMNPRPHLNQGKLQAQVQVHAFWRQADALTFLSERNARNGEGLLRLWAQELSKTGKRRFIVSTAEDFFRACCGFPWVSFYFYFSSPSSVRCLPHTPSSPPPTVRVRNAKRSSSLLFSSLLFSSLSLVSSVSTATSSRVPRFSLSQDQRSFYEVICDSRPCRLYFDLEFYREYNPADLDGNELTDLLLRLCALHLLRRFGLLLRRRDVLVLDSSTEKKFSRHLVLHLCTCHRRRRRHEALFASNAHAGAFVGELAAISREGGEFARLWVAGKEKGSKSFFADLGVYTTNRSFRLYLSSKFGRGAGSILLPPSSPSSFPFPSMLAMQTAARRPGGDGDGGGGGVGVGDGSGSSDPEFAFFMDSLISASPAQLLGPSRECTLQYRAVPYTVYRTPYTVYRIPYTVHRTLYSVIPLEI